MGDLLRDLLNDRIAPVPTRGTVNGVLDYGTFGEDVDDISLSPPESDTEQEEFVKRELDSYFSQPQEASDGLTDIDDGHEESILGSDIMELAHVPRVFDMYRFDTYSKRELPIDSFKGRILDLLTTASVVIIHGPTGCGKTTQVPQYILDQCKATKSPCNIVVTQPRRIAAINIAQRVCEERGWSLGTVCGYQVGLDKNVGEDVILTYMTTEVLLQKLISQKNLNAYTHIIIDEVHERNKSLDFLLLIARKYLFTNSTSVKLVLMSATMEAQQFAHYFRSISRNNPHGYLPAPILHINKKSEYETNVYYNEHFAKMVNQQIPYNIDDPCITAQQYEMCLKLLTFFDKLDETENHLVGNIVPSVLVFLPGYHEIEEMHKILSERRTSRFSWEIVPLHSSLTSEHMVKVFQKQKEGCRKIILSTNIAESSVTVSDVKYVVDFCLTKIMCTNEITKFSTLSLQWASRNNCVQRAGRVGRVSDGRVYRLVPEDFYNSQLQENTIPELQRAPLENVVLYMKLLDLNDTPKNVLSLAISPPNLKDVETCIWHLKEVGALLTTCRGHKTAADGDLTFVGRVMGSLPIDIRLSKLILLGHMFSCLEETVIMAAGAMTRNIFVHSFHQRFLCYKNKLIWSDGSQSDFIALLNLYHVWLNVRREQSFRFTNEEMVWCKTHFVNLKGLREWEILIKEINSRLKRFKIEKATGVAHVRLTGAEKPTVLKVIICGAFYPHYFVRSSDFGQVDSKEAVKILNGRDPCNTVYFTNMKLNQPGHIYVRQIKDLLEAENSQDIQIGFDGQSSKVFVEYKNIRQPEPVTVEGRQFLTTIPGNIARGVYEAVRKRQLNIPFRLKILPDHKAWDFAKSKEEQKEEINCYSEIDYSPLPPLDIQYITVTVTHIVDAGQFYCQNWNDETRMLLDRIFVALNGPGVFLEPIMPDEKVELRSQKYAARFNEDSKFYRCVVINISGGSPHTAHVQFIDYGNVQQIPINRLYRLPTECLECFVQPIAMCCVLSEVQPNIVVNPKGLWTKEVNTIFKRKAERVLLNAKVYSVVDDIVHLELFSQNPGPNNLSFNKWLINEGHGQVFEESHRSKMDHQLRQKILSSESPNTSASYQKLSTAKNYTDFEGPSISEATEVVELKGPFSPLEMRVCGLVQASSGTVARVEGDSVNAVLLDDNPEDPHARLLVAASVSQSSSGQAMKLSQTTVMPSVPGLPVVMMLLFCPQMEPKLVLDKSRVASILCGLGCNETTFRPNFPMHDISMVLDTDLKEAIIVKINEMRYYMNNAVKIMSNIYDELEYPRELFTYQLRLKERLFDLLHLRHESVERVNVKYSDVWKKTLCENYEILKVKDKGEEDDIWPLLWFVKLAKKDKTTVDIEKNLHELDQIAKRLATQRPIVCELCGSEALRTIEDVRIHIFRDQHKRNLEKYGRDDEH